MPSKSLDSETKQKLLQSQKNEITEYHIYTKLSKSVEDEHNSETLRKIGKEEKEHYDFWKKYTGEEVKPSKLKIWFYFLIAKIFGITFGIQLMEKGEEEAQDVYKEIAKTIPQAKKIVEDEDEHEHELIEMIDEERLNYVGAVVRGLNDALVELTGALAGLTFVLNNTELIGVTGLITGIAASLSMGGSEYLGRKSEESVLDPKKASIYTGGAYIITVLFLIFPYMLSQDVYLSLGWMITNAVIVIFLFTFYTSVAKDMSFKSRFLEMTSISLGIALLTFVIGFLIRNYFGVEI